MPQTRRPMPDGFCEDARRMIQRDLAIKYQTSSRSIQRWLDQCGIERKKRPYVHLGLPENIEALCAEFGIKDIARKTGWSEDVIRTRLKRDRPELHAMAVANGYAKRAAMGNGRKKNETPRVKPPKRPPPRLPKTYVSVGEEQVRAKTAVDKAMRWLQRYGVCYPMRVHNPKLTDYIFKGKRMTGEQILQEAIDRGWRVDDWKEIAA